MKSRTVISQSAKRTAIPKGTKDFSILNRWFIKLLPVHVRMVNQHSNL